MLVGENITVIQLVDLFISCGFQKCELWTEKTYILTHHKSKSLRSHVIASKKMDLLHEAGFSYMDAQRLVMMEGKQKVNKKNLSLLGEPLWTGTIEELSNKQNLWNKSVCDCHIKGLFRNKIQIILEDDDTDVKLEQCTNSTINPLEPMYEIYGENKNEFVKGLSDLFQVDIIKETEEYIRILIKDHIITDEERYTFKDKYIKLLNSLSGDIQIVKL